MMFDGFLGEDFEAYLPSKWSSNMYTLQRRKVKDKLDIIGKQLQDTFKENGLELVLHLSDDFPSLWNKKKVDTQWLFFSRDLNAQKKLSEVIDTEKTLAATLEDPTPLYRHIFLGVAVSESTLEVGIRLHFDAWVDRKNLLAIFNDAGKSDDFITLCKGLPEQVGLGISTETLTSVNDISNDTLSQFSSQFESNKGWMFFGRRFEKDAAVEKGAGILNEVAETMNQLVDAYKFMSWSPENDAVSMDNILEKKLQEREATHQEAQQAKQEREDQQRQIVEQRQREKEQKKQEMLEEQAWREQERAKRRAAAIARREREAAQKNAPLTPPTENESPSPKAEEKKSTSVKEATKESNAAPEGNVKPEAKRSFKNKKFDKSNAQNDGGPKSRHNRGSFDRSKQSKNKGKFPKKYKGKENSNKAPKLANVSEERKADIQIGDFIVVVDGLLKDKRGIVQSIDEKGDLKVSFGMLSSRVAQKDVKGLGPSV